MVAGRLLPDVSSCQWILFPGCHSNPGNYVISIMNSPPKLSQLNQSDGNGTGQPCHKVIQQR